MRPTEGVLKDYFWYLVWPLTSTEYSPLRSDTRYGVSACASDCISRWARQVATVNDGQGRTR